MTDGRWIWAMTGQEVETIVAGSMQGAGAIFRCLGILAAYVLSCGLVLLPIRFFTKVPSFIFRKLLHIVAVSGVCVMIAAADSWPAAALTAVILAAVIYPLLAMLERKAWFGKLFVEKQPGEVKQSALLLLGMVAAVIAVCWGVFRKPHLAAASILMWGVGDAAAAMVGIPFGKHKVPLADGKKSWEGSFAMLGCAFLVGSVALFLLQRSGLPRVLFFSGVGAFLGAAAELFSPSEYDTVTVPLVIAAGLLLLDHWL